MNNFAETDVSSSVSSSPELLHHLLLHLLPPAAVWLSRHGGWMLRAAGGHLNALRFPVGGWT